MTPNRFTSTPPRDIALCPTRNLMSERVFTRGMGCGGESVMLQVRGHSDEVVAPGARSPPRESVPGV